MAFGANRDIKIEASQRADGTFALRTRGLGERRRPELEIVGVPDLALRAAGGILNDVADYTVNRAEVLADQNVGFQLAQGDTAEGDDDGARALMLAVRAVAVEAPTGGLWSKLTGSGKGVLRLVDITGDRSAPPLTALATMLVHRAALRRAKEDAGGAREELEAAIAVFPGEPGAGRAPEVGDGTATFNWQNHLAYLALAELGGDDAPARFGEALARSDELAKREIGAALGALGSPASPASPSSRDADALERHAAAILRTNANAHRSPGPTPALAIVASPVWEARRGGGAARRASLVPAKFGELYFEGVAAEALRTTGARIAARALASRDVGALAWTVRDTRRLWIAAGAPFAVDLPDYLPPQGILSGILAEVARCFRAGATEAEIEARLAGDTPPALADKLAVLGAWEGEQFFAAMST